MSRTQLWRIVLHALQINCNSFQQNNLEELKHSNWNARHYRLTLNGSLFLGHTVYHVTIKIIMLDHFSLVVSHKLKSFNISSREVCRIEKSLE